MARRNKNAGVDVSTGGPSGTRGLFKDPYPLEDIADSKMISTGEAITEEQAEIHRTADAIVMNSRIASASKFLPEDDVVRTLLEDGRIGELSLPMFRTSVVLVIGTPDEAGAAADSLFEKKLGTHLVSSSSGNAGLTLQFPQNKFGHPVFIVLSKNLDKDSAMFAAVHEADHASTMILDEIGIPVDSETHAYMSTYIAEWISSNFIQCRTTKFDGVIHYHISRACRHANNKKDRK